MTRPLRLGYWLSSEEHPPEDLVNWSVRAEQAGFATAMISDHFHPWTSQQGQSSFVWSVLGGIAGATERLEVGTGVTTPIIRTHPVVIAQAAATVARMMPGRFFLGVGTGERLNEHITGTRWPRVGVRRQMLEEAVGIIRRLFEGGNVNHEGTHFTVEHAQLFSLPDEPPPIFVAAGGKRSASLAGRIGDGLIATSPSSEQVEAFDTAGGAGKPRVGKVTVCLAEDEKAARATATRLWPNAPMKGSIVTDLARPADFEQMATLVSEDDVAGSVICDPDPETHLAAIKEFAAAGFDTVYIHQVGPDQERLLGFYRDEILPRLGRTKKSP